PHAQVRRATTPRNNPRCDCRVRRPKKKRGDTSRPRRPNVGYDAETDPARRQRPPIPLGNANLIDDGEPAAVDLCEGAARIGLTYLCIHCFPFLVGKSTYTFLVGKSSSRDQLIVGREVVPVARGDEVLVAQIQAL